MKYDSNIEKFDVHNVAYDPSTKSFLRWPVALLSLSDKFLAISFHKWCVPEGTNRGYFLVFIKLCPSNNISRDATENTINHIKTIYSEYTDSFIQSIEDTTFSSEHFELIYFRWYINVWRQVEKPKKKWIYVDEKPSKDDPCCIERILYT